MVKKLDGYDSILDKLNAHDTSLADIASQKIPKTPLNYGGKCNGVNSDDTAVTSLLAYCNTNKIKAVLPNGTVITSVIDIPVGVNVELQGQIIFSGSGTLRANGSNYISGGSILNSAGNYQGLMLYGGNITVNNISFTGSAGRFGISGLYTDRNGHNVEIVNCKFDTVQYGILFQGAPGFGYNNLRIHGNTVTNVILGDGIEINIGDSNGVEIYNNTVDGVTAQGSAGIGIGVAGKGPYSLTTVYTMKNVSIHDNIVRNVDVAYAVGNAAIHVECVEGAKVYNNKIYTSCKAFESFGSHSVEAYDNYVLDCRDGMEHAVGFTSGAFVMASKNNVMRDNTVENTTMIANSYGIRNVCEGDGITTRTKQNVVKNVATGIKIQGASNQFMESNDVYGCTTPYVIDYAMYLKPSATNTTLNVTKNRAFNADGTRNTTSNPHTANMFYMLESFYEGNDFSPYSPASATIPSNGTIKTASISLARYAPTASVTGIILQAGTINGQEVAIINESTFSITFASTGSNVADGSSDIINGGTVRKFLWSSSTSLWYRIQ
jgi:hypothetical protein